VTGLGVAHHAALGGGGAGTGSSTDRVQGDSNEPALDKVEPLFPRFPLRLGRRPHGRRPTGPQRPSCHDAIDSCVRKEEENRRQSSLRSDQSPRHCSDRLKLLVRSTGMRNRRCHDLSPVGRGGLPAPRTLRFRDLQRRHGLHGTGGPARRLAGQEREALLRRCHYTPCGYTVVASEILAGLDREKLIPK
jgi:hypothetical protein